MKSLFVFCATITMLASSAFAEKVTSETSVRGINEKVQLSYLADVEAWGYTEQLTGFVMGTNVVKIIPVTEKAFKVLSNLDKTARYNCILVQSTYVAEQPIGGSYFTLNINCN